MRADRQTERHTDTLIAFAIFRTPIWGELIRINEVGY